MTKLSLTAAILSPLVFLASCGAASSGDSQPVSTPAPSGGGTGEVAFATEELARFEEPWAAAFAQGTQMLFITEKAGALKWFDMASKRTGTVTGAPQVAYGGQGGFGDIAFLPSESAATIGTRTVYLSWAEAGPGNTFGAAVGRGQLVCAGDDTCSVRDLEVI